ncbi:hypothetical protein ACQCX2_09470 [Propionibacteriaceae bacterium Y1700]|uniref:hypothetical protein n=1 Tax=Microlunatus sp. Y1700 TaxID=3418487 RepID=UPI003DA7604C
MKITRTAAVLGTAAAITLGGVVGAAAENYMRPADSENPIAVAGCVIRFDEREGTKTIPRIHANQSHMCVGVTDVEVNEDGDLVVNSDKQGAIVSLVVSPDETMSKMGLSCGGSGGIGHTTVRCYDRTGKHVRADGPDIYNPWGNLWLSWFIWEK